MEINNADVAELVDARDLKSLAPIDRAAFPFKTCQLRPVRPGAEPACLQNILNAPSKEQRGHLAKGIKEQMHQLAELTR